MRYRFAIRNTRSYKLEQRGDKSDERKTAWTALIGRVEIVMLLDCRASAWTASGRFDVALPHPIKRVRAETADSAYCNGRRCEPYVRSRRYIQPCTAGSLLASVISPSPASLLAFLLRASVPLRSPTYRVTVSLSQNLATFSRPNVSSFSLDVLLRSVAICSPSDEYICLA